LGGGSFAYSGIRGGSVSRKVSRSFIRSGPSVLAISSGIVDLLDGSMRSMSSRRTVVVCPFSSPIRSSSPRVRTVPASTRPSFSSVLKVT
jgi:hypothetical protein